MHAHERREQQYAPVWRDVASRRQAIFNEQEERLSLTTAFGRLEVRVEPVRRTWCTVAEISFPHALTEQFELSQDSERGLWRVVKRPFVFDSPRQIVLRVRGSRAAARAILDSEARGSLIALAEIADEFRISEQRLLARIECLIDETSALERLIDRAILVAKYLKPSALRAHGPYR